jgi:hypothetical protein
MNLNFADIIVTDNSETLELNAFLITDGIYIDASY